MCSLFGFTKQAYYKQLKANEQNVAKEDIVVGLIQKKREIWKRGSGRNLHQSLKSELKSHDIKLGRDKFFDLLRENSLLIKSKRFRTKTTCSYHHFNRHPNLIENAVPVRANEIWVSDITYVWLKERDRFCYLSLITDLYSRKIMGHCVHENLSVKGCIEALQIAMKQRKNTEELIHHSDRGVQYCCHAYNKILRKNNIRSSMTQTGDPLENAVAERINKTIKEEFTDDRQMNFASLELAKENIKSFIKFYNNQRPHRSINWLTPSQAYQQTGTLQRVWKKYLNKKLEWGDLI
ncbi:MAG: IS3 family transposase [Bacteroidota bacterium]|jgi:transposase InsO family protein|nr:IS3 family transposase [Bacteroidota bacterium]